MVSFKLTEQSLIHLKKEHIPDEILQNLKVLENQVVTNKKDFLSIVKKHIGDEQTVRYKELILKHATVFIPYWDN